MFVAPPKKMRFVSRMQKGRTIITSRGGKGKKEGPLALPTRHRNRRSLSFKEPPSIRRGGEKKGGSSPLSLEGREHFERCLSRGKNPSSLPTARRRGGKGGVFFSCGGKTQSRPHCKRKKGRQGKGRVNFAAEGGGRNGKRKAASTR